MTIELGAVGVVAALQRVVDARAEADFDEASDHLQAAAEAGAGVANAGVLGASYFGQVVGSSISVQHTALDERGQIVGWLLLRDCFPRIGTRKESKVFRSFHRGSDRTSAADGDRRRAGPD